MMPIHTILHPTDFSANSAYALEVAVVMAQAHRARLVVLHVVPGMAPVVGGPDLSALERADRAQRDLKVYREEMMIKLKEIRPSGVSVDHLLFEGELAPAIRRAAEDTHCDLIVMGTHGRTEPVRRLLGSVAEQVLHEAPCAVLTVKVPPGMQIEPCFTAEAVELEGAVGDW